MLLVAVGGCWRRWPRWSAGWPAAADARARRGGRGRLVTAASYTLSTLVLAWADAVDPQLVLPFGLGLYVAKFTLLGVVMVAWRRPAGPGWSRSASASSPGVVVWTGVHIWWLATVHARRPRR